MHPMQPPREVIGGQLGDVDEPLPAYPEPTRLEAVQAEVDAEPANRAQAAELAAAADGDEEAEPPEGTVTVYLVVEGGEPGGEPVRITPPGTWRGSAFRALNGGDFDRWAELALFGDDYFDVWRELDPTWDEVQGFMKAYKRAAGQSLGESRASRRSSRSTARR